MEQLTLKHMNVCQNMVLYFVKFPVTFDFRDVPKEFLSDFVAENPEAESKMATLKNRVKNSPLEVIEG